ncbi:MAG TPA: hypothetical protein VN706_18260 [Gemmatimonadaceae bacterium]|nr:hypothetical protein [Gemmatimonadaceae bacterium]
MRLGLTNDARTCFILRHGVVPWGIIAGALAALGAALGVRGETASSAPASAATIAGIAGIAGIAAMCFVIWCFVAGWAVGAARWELRQHSNPTTPMPRSRERPRGPTRDE